jgi:hypothetical protein
LQCLRSNQPVDREIGYLDQKGSLLRATIVQTSETKITAAEKMAAATLAIFSLLGFQKDEVPDDFYSQEGNEARLDCH